MATTIHSDAPPGRSTGPGGPTAPRGILPLAGPLIFSFWMRSLFSLVDTIYAATLGDAAVAAVGLAIPLEFLMIACWVGVSTGLTSTLARAIGARDEPSVRGLLDAGARIVRWLIPCFVGLGGLVFLAAPRLGLDPEVARQFAIYGSVLVAGSAISSFWSILPDSIVKAHHDTRSTMWAGVWSNVLNVGLNTLFTFVFHWGIFGIAFSTVLGRFGGLVYASRRAGQLERARVAGEAADPRAGGAPAEGAAGVRSILLLAVPSAATYALMAMESTLINALLATLDQATEAIAAYSIYFRVLLLALMPIMAVSVAMLPYAARRFGEADIAGVRRGLREATIASAAYSVFLVAPAMALGGRHIAGALAEAPVTAAYTGTALQYCAPACLAAIPFILIRPVFEAMQRGRPGLMMALVRYGLLTAPLALGGAALGRLTGFGEFGGLLCGLILSAAAASGLFALQVRSALRSLDPVRGGTARSG